MQGMTRFDPEGKSFLPYQVRVVKVLWSGCLLVLLFRRQAAEVVLCAVVWGFCWARGLVAGLGSQRMGGWVALGRAFAGRPYFSPFFCGLW